MLLLGGFDQNPVPEDDINEATRVLKLYVTNLINAGIPIRPSDHAMIHMPLDARCFKCGVELPFSTRISIGFSEVFLDLVTNLLSNIETD